MVWGIIGALQEEVALLCNRMTISQKKVQLGITYYTGTIGDNNVVVVQSGIGKINATICTQILICEYHVDSIINVGVAGSLDNRVGILDLVVSNQAVFHDIDLEMYERYAPFCCFYPANQNLIDRCTAVLDSQTDTHYQVGLVCTGDEFIEDKQKKEDIIQRLHPLCVEMEGAAVAQTAYVNQIPFVIVRVISDNADNSADNTYDNFLEEAAKRSSELVIALLTK